MTEYRDTDIAAVLDSIEDQCRPSFEYMPDLVADLLVGYLAQIRLSITLPPFPSMSVNDWEARYGTMTKGSSAVAEDPTYSHARYTARDVACPLCDVSVGEPCLTASGRATTKAHQGRIYARMRAIQDDRDGTTTAEVDSCPPQGVERVFIDALKDPWGVDDILDAEDRRVLAARQQVLDAAERVRQERLAMDVIRALADSSAEEIIEF